MDYLMNEKNKEMPPPKVLAKKLEQQNERAGSGTSKGKQKELHEQETKTSRSLSKDANANSKDQKRHVKHSERVESELQRYFEGMKLEDEKEDEDKPVYSITSEEVKRLSRKRTLQESDNSYFDDSPSGPERAEESRRKILYTGGQPQAIDLTGESGEAQEALARRLDSQFTSGKVRSEGPSVGFPANKSDTLQQPLKAMDDKKRDNSLSV